MSEDRFRYSGEADLVLINAWLPDRGDPVVDWQSTICGQLRDDRSGVHTLSLPEVIERISRDLGDAAGDAYYGVGEVTSELPDPPSGGFSREVVTAVLANIAASLATRASGL